MTFYVISCLACLACLAAGALGGYVYGRNTMARDFLNTMSGGKKP